MIPKAVAKRLTELGIGWVSITDHNTCGNVRAFKNTLEKNGIKVIPGIEIQSLEDVHILGYFNSVDIAEEYSKWLEGKMKKINLDPEKFGYQLYTNENDEYYSMEENWLGQPVNLSIDRVFSSIYDFGGIAAFAHIERQMGVLYQMGFIPKMKTKPIIEIAFKKTVSKYDFIRDFHYIHSSDAHNIDMLKPTMNIATNGRTFTNFANSITNNNQEDRVKIIWD